MKRLFLIPALAALAACSSITDALGGGACTADFRYGVSVVVTDSLTGEPIASGAKLVVRDGAYADSMEFLSSSAPGLNALSGAGERAGTYTLTVTKPGYETWVKSGVRVTRDECHVIPVTVQARLRRLP